MAATEFSDETCVLCFFLFGMPGAGKGVSAQVLKEEKGFAHLSMGEYLRRLVRENHPLSKRYEAHITSGQVLLPCAVVQKLFQEVYKEAPTESHWVVDGFPRTRAQLTFLMDFLQVRRCASFFIHLDVNEEVAVRRLLTRQTCLKCGHDFIDVQPKRVGACDACKGVLYKRKTDNPQCLRRRIQLFHETTGSVLGALREGQQLLSIDANGPIAAVAQEVTRIVASLIPSPKKRF